LNRHGFQIPPICYIFHSCLRTIYLGYSPKQHQKGLPSRQPDEGRAAVRRLERPVCHAAGWAARQRHDSESLAGVVLRELPRTAGKAVPGVHANKAELAGDLDGGLLLLDESSDNVSITGTWNGEMVEGSCGKIFRGTWKDTSASAPANAPDVAFTLTRKP
jgi:hypothetical protein